MKARSIPFGYKMENGKVIPHPDESQTVGEILSAYLDGRSLLRIAEHLNERRVEYLPGVTGWNKARLKRILEDVRYLGNETYPAIVRQTDFARAQELKAARNTQKDLDRTADIFRLGAPVYCEDCGGRMKRRYDGRRKHKETWTCQSCGTIVKIPDEELLKAITGCLNSLIANPDAICWTPVQEEPSAELIRLKNEIERMLDSPAIDKELLKSRMFEYSSRLYDGLDATERVTEQIREAMKSTKPLASYDRKLMEKTVSAIMLHADGTVSLTLKNGQQAGKEKTNATAGTAETGAHNPADSAAGKCAELTSCSQAGSGILPGIYQAGRTA